MKPIFVKYYSRFLLILVGIGLLSTVFSSCRIRHKTKYGPPPGNYGKIEKIDQQIIDKENSATTTSL